MHEQEVDRLVGHLFRQEAGRMAAVLTRLFGFEHLEQSEDIVQDTLLTALSVWKIKGVPDKPSAWLHTVAKRKAIDVIRSRKIRAEIHSQIAQALQSEWTFTPAINRLFLENEIEDSQLRMIFACCHHSIPYDSQIALTLKTLCGLSVAEIARAFLTTEETITKRLYRAREKIRAEKIDLEVPLIAELPQRLEAVLHTLYLFFNEGYNSSHPERLIRQDLCEEAIRLCLLLTRNSLTDTPEANALLALMCFQASREEARLSSSGEIILLKDQDRDLWNKKLIEKGLMYLNAATREDTFSEYYIEAAIGACHAIADRFETTNWTSIHNLYEALSKIKPGPVVELNRAIALGYSVSPKSGLEALLKIKGLEETHLYYAALGDFYRETNDRKNSLVAYEKAIALATSGQEKELLIKKRETLL
jgi:RNA polymerase sigma-70 factor (ECF subfamily)